ARRDVVEVSAGVLGVDVGLGVLERQAVDVRAAEVHLVGDGQTGVLEGQHDDLAEYELLGELLGGNADGLVLRETETPGSYQCERDQGGKRSFHTASLLLANQPRNGHLLV